MLMLPPGSRVFVATSCVDGRKGIDGLSALVRSQFGQDPLFEALHRQDIAVAIPIQNTHAVRAFGEEHEQRPEQRSTSGSRKSPSNRASRPSAATASLGMRMSIAHWHVVSAERLDALPAHAPEAADQGHLPGRSMQKRALGHARGPSQVRESARATCSKLLRE
jgi:hypothetical protein